MGVLGAVVEHLLDCRAWTWGTPSEDDCEEAYLNGGKDRAYCFHRVVRFWFTEQYYSTKPSLAFCLLEALVLVFREAKKHNTLIEWLRYRRLFSNFFTLIFLSISPNHYT